MKKKCSLNDLLGNRLQDSYESQYRYVMQLLEEGRVTPVKSAPGNGKKPALQTQYWVLEAEKDYSAWKEELLYRTDPHIHVDYYLRHPDVYDRDRPYVRRLSDYLQHQGSEPSNSLQHQSSEPSNSLQHQGSEPSNSLQHQGGQYSEYLQHQGSRLAFPVSRNERSFEIWGEEKFLTGGMGRTILGRCGLEEAVLNTYATAEPFAYFASHRSVPQKILILENKDPFFGMRRYLLEGNRRILGEEIGTLIYGAGKRVISSFREFETSAEPYMKDSGNSLLYLGDLDYEGIVIYETLADTFARTGQIRPFLPAYLAMLDKADLAQTLPQTKEHQNQNHSGRFFSCFDEDTVRRMKTVLESGRYIPQEILNMGDY